MTGGTLCRHEGQTTERFFAQPPKKGYPGDHAMGTCVDVTQSGLEGVLKIMQGSSPSVAASAESWRASAGFHWSGACAHSLCSSGAAAPTSPASVRRSSTTV